MTIKNNKPLIITNIEEEKIFNLITNAGNTAKNMIDRKTLVVIDQNNDGKISIDNVEVIANSVIDKLKNGANVILESVEDGRRNLDLKLLQPIFSDTLNKVDFLISKFIRICFI